MKIADLIITELVSIDGFGLTSDEYLFGLEELQDGTIAQSEDTSDITGKGGRKLSTLKRNKALTISGTNGVISHGLLEIQTGNEFANGKTKVEWTETLTVKDNKANTTYAAVGTTGAEIIGCFVKKDSVLTTELKQGTSAASGTFTYASKVLTFSGLDNDTEVFVIYKREITADYLISTSDAFSEKCQLYVNALAEDLCGNIYKVQIYIPKADFSGEFSLEMGDNQTVQDFEAQALAGACGIAGQLWTYTVFGADTEDAA